MKINEVPLNYMERYISEKFELDFEKMSTEVLRMMPKEMNVKEFIFKIEPKLSITLKT